MEVFKVLEFEEEIAWPVVETMAIAARFADREDCLGIVASKQRKFWVEELLLLTEGKT